MAPDEDVQATLALDSALGNLHQAAADLTLAVALSQRHDLAGDASVLADAIEAEIDVLETVIARYWRAFG